jgi:hypothetical protein
MGGQPVVDVFGNAIRHEMDEVVNSGRIAFVRQQTCFPNNPVPIGAEERPSVRRSDIAKSALDGVVLPKSKRSNRNLPLHHHEIEGAACGVPIERIEGSHAVGGDFDFDGTVIEGVPYDQERVV